MRKVNKIGRVQTVNDDPSETIQSDAHLADINVIVSQFEEGGIDMLDETALIYDDISEFTDLADAMNQAIAAKLDFMKLPSKVREIFDHDVAVWLDTAHDQEKRDALVEAGYLKADVVDAVEVGVGGAAVVPAEAEPPALPVVEGE